MSIENPDQEEVGPDHAAHLAAMWAGQSNVLVALRIRPVLKHDISRKSCVRALDSKVVVVMDPAANDKADILRMNRSREKQYAFDFVFDQNASQEMVYINTTKFLIHGVLDGYNATVFAYGQTGSGKTHTMIGNPSDSGIMVRVMEDLFAYCNNQSKSQGVQFKVIVSFLEVYNENIKDLLSDVEDYLDLREDPIKGPVVAGITEVQARSGIEVMQLLHQGNSRRSQAATAANEVSSRSHAVLQIVVESQDKAPGVVANIKVGKLSLVDLAGSERAANTKNSGVRLVEGANINRSLLALGNCINALGEKGNKGNFVPYRDSKLTRLLKDSLGGNCRTVMIAAISSAESSFEETLNTLKYANRAKNIKSTVRRNVLNVDYHISEYVQLINNLRNEIKDLKDQISHPSSALPTAASRPLLQPIDIQRGATPKNIISLASPHQILREGLRSGISTSENVHSTAGRELVNKMRALIVENFQERMQLRRSLIELEDQNVQNSIEISKRQILMAQAPVDENGVSINNEAFQECEQLKKAIVKNNGVRKNIAKRLRANEKEADSVRHELDEKITGEDKKELMELQYQVGRLELENMELEQHRIVHESILKGKDLTIQKLKLQIVLRDKIIARQREVLAEHGLVDRDEDRHLSLIESTIIANDAIHPVSPPKSLKHLRQASTSSSVSIQLPDAEEVSEGLFVSHHQQRPSLLINDKVLQPLRYSPKASTPKRSKQQPLHWGGRDNSMDRGGGVNVEDESVGMPLSGKSPAAVMGNQNRSLLTLSVHKLPLHNESIASMELPNSSFANDSMGYLHNNDVLLNSRDRRAVETGDWSEIQPTSTAFPVEEDLTSIGIIGEQKNIYRPKNAVKKNRYTQNHRRAVVHPTNEADAEDSSVDVMNNNGIDVLPLRIYKKQVSMPMRQSLLHTRSNENSIDNSDIGDLEMEPSMIQINGIGNQHRSSYGGKGSSGITSKPVTRVLTMDKLSPITHPSEYVDMDVVPIDESRGKRLASQKIYDAAPYDMLLNLPKKSPRGRLANDKGDKVGAIMNKVMSPRPSDEYQSSNAFNNNGGNNPSTGIAVRMGGLQLVAPKGLQKAYGPYK